MSSLHQISIEEFISSIPVCQDGCALETILNTSQSSKDGTVAIVDNRHFPLGIVTAHRLLSLVVKHQYNRRITTLVGSEKHRSCRAALMATTDLTSALEPLKVLNKKVTIAKFLRCSRQGLDCQKFGYAVVDDHEEFLGILDTHKLYEYLFWQGKKLSTATEPSFPGFDLIKNISSPLMLLGSENKILYQNRSWQEHFSPVQERANNYSSQVARWWLGQQVSKDGEQLEINSNESEQTSFFTGLKAAEQIPINLLSEGGLLVSSTSKVQISYLGGWYYVKVPLHFARSGNTSSASPHWIVLAVERENEMEPQDLAREIDWYSLQNRFLAYSSHELKSPLTGIIGLSNLLKAQKLGTLNQRQISYAELIYRSGKKSLSIVNNLLKLSELSGCQSSLTIEPIALEILCRQTYRQILAKLKYRDGLESSFPQLELSIAPNSQTAFVDRSYLTQIISRSLEWAISTQPKQIGITIDSWTGWLKIVVWNQIEILSSPQQQFGNREFVEIDDSQDQNDSELNLLLARQLAKAHGGDASTIFQGSGRNELTLLLPQTVENDRLKSERKRLLVLIVEPHPYRLAKITSEIHKLGYHSVVARSGIEALQQARQLKPSYILLAPNSAPLGGKDLLTLLKSERDTRNIPVFILTTAQNKLHDSAIFRQVQGLICEPFNRDTLAEILPAKYSAPSRKSSSITILCIYPEPEAIDKSLKTENLDFSLKYWAEREWTTEVGDENSRHQVCYRIIEADGLEQARMLAGIWQLDVIILDSVAIANPLKYLQSLQQSPTLAALPLITLDSQTSAAANQIPDLTVYPCLLPAKTNSIKDLMQVIRIATKTKRFA